MGPDKNSIDTAKKLGNTCFYNSIKNRKQENNICMQNVINVMLKNDYDIIHTQETKNWNDLYNYLIKNKPNYKYICLEANEFVYLVTFYDHTKLILVGAKYMDFGNGRPVILAKFIEKKSNTEFISINLHAGHYKIDIKLINKTEKYDMDISINDGNLFKSNLKTDKNFNTSSKASFKNLPIILGGDTNDHKNYNYWKGLNILDKTLKSDIQPPNTCCTTSNNYNYSSGYGDYFIYSNDFNAIQNNTLIEANYPSSDHAPVYIELEFKNGNNNNKQSIKTQSKNTLNTSPSTPSGKLANKPSSKQQKSKNIINNNVLNSKIIFINT